MSEFGTIVERDLQHATIKFERSLEADIAKTWRWLTEPDRLERWMAPTQIDVRVGGTVEHRFDETDDGLARGRILRVDVPHLLEYEWRFPGEPDSAVCFELRAEGDRTVITLTHRMLGVGHAAGYGAGWHAHLDVLEAAMVGGALSWDECFGEIIGDYQTRFTPPSPATTSTGTPDADGTSSAATTTGQTEP
jgi:uncharacterized protein YndB with AHSA1/START domain